MTDGDSRFQGAVPLGGDQIPTITCLWHQLDFHPADAPPCRFDEKREQWVTEMPALIGWLTVNLTRLLSASNVMAQQLGEVGVHLEALEATLSE